MRIPMSKTGPRHGLAAVLLVMLTPGCSYEALGPIDQHFSTWPRSQAVDHPTEFNEFKGGFSLEDARRDLFQLRASSELDAMKLSKRRSLSDGACRSRPRGLYPAASTPH